MNNNKGFTIVELMIAISVFTTILLMTTVGIIQITKAYYRGIVQASTQQTTRAVMNSVAQNIQFSSFQAKREGTPVSNASLGAGYILRSVCLGDQQQFTYLLNYKQSSSRPSGDVGPMPSSGFTSKHTLWQSPVQPDCTPVNLSLANPGVGKELLGENMRLTKFEITQASLVDPDLFNVAITIMYGDDDLLDFGNTNPINRTDPNSGNWRCNPLRGVFSSAFCAKSELTTAVGKRLSLGIE